MPHRPPRSTSVVVLVALAALLGAAHAQFGGAGLQLPPIDPSQFEDAARVGTVKGSLGEDTGPWVVLASVGPDAPPLASWRPGPDGEIAELSVAAVPASGEGRLLLVTLRVAEPPSGCPCVYPDADLFVLATSLEAAAGAVQDLADAGGADAANPMAMMGALGAMEGMLMGGGGMGAMGGAAVSMTLERFEAVGPDAYRIDATLTGELVNLQGLLTGAGGVDAVAPIDLTLRADPVTPLRLGE